MPSKLKKARKEVKRLRAELKAIKAKEGASKKEIKRARRALKKAKTAVALLKSSHEAVKDAVEDVKAGIRRRTRSMSAEMEKKKKKKRKKNAKDEKDENFKDFDDHFQKTETSKAKRNRSTADSGGNVGSGKKPAKSASAEAEKWRKSNNITLGGSACDMGVWQTFEDVRPHIAPKVMKILDDAGFAKPTPIQAQCWPIASRGRDIVGVAETGSGKTLAFLIPALSKLVSTKSKKTASMSPKMLVLSPTRELAMQIQEVADESCRACGLVSLCVYGGVPKYPQIAQLRKGVDVVVATPGRLRDLVENSGLALSNVLFFALDEADRMLDLGFMPEIRAIASHLPPREKRQSLMYTATWPNAVRKLAEEFVNDPVKVTVGSDVLTANHRVTQRVDVVEGREKDQKLQGLLRKYCGDPRKHKMSKERLLLFVLYKKEAGRVERALNQRGWNAVGIHGDKGQYDRTAALEAFRSGRKLILVATDVAARGLDIPDVKYVINYTFPLTIED